MRLSFGEFTLDTETRRLCQGESPRHLSPKAFELLRLLLDHRPRVLSKAEVHERLWPSTFVSDATLTSLVAEVRAALGEKARHGRFVRTVHRFGYAFQGTVTEFAAPAQPLDARARCWIIWEWGQVALTNGDHLLGRDGDVTVWLESPTVSRHHAQIRVAGGDATIEDLGSKNGTFVRGKRLTTPSLLSDGDDIRIGSVEVTFRTAGIGGSTETQRPRASFE
jgi:DNA-binding winged helix-turn-helix (wHTH) protein